MRKNSQIARALATQTWGTVQQQRKLADGIWSYCTASHGGIVVDTNIRPEINIFFPNDLVTCGKDQYIKSEQHFVALEEDCNATVAIWLYSDEILTKKYYERNCFNTLSHNTPSPTSFEEWKGKELSIAKESLEAWNKAVLEKYPSQNEVNNDVSFTYEFNVYGAGEQKECIAIQMDTAEHAKQRIEGVHPCNCICLHQIIANVKHLDASARA